MKHSWIFISAALLVCGAIAYRFFDVLANESARRDCRGLSSLCLEMGNCVEPDLVNYKDAMEILRSEQTSWLAVIGFFGVAFGLLIPAGAYLLQRQSLRDERENLNGKVV